ncbi:hypothetical protein C8R46DRAFT_216277 [Mycena filopes]|nr:hypothetical protein C8R46DRAFT_216277 [Mycena filopes]
MGALRTLILQGGDQPNEDDSDSESEVGQSLKAIIQRISGEDNEPEDALTGTGTRPEFAWHEEPRSPPSRMSFNSERNRASSDIEDDAISIYSQFSSTYTFRSRSSSARRKRSMKRNGKGGRLSRRMTAMSMMSVYSQGSFCAGDAIDLPSVPTLPWGLTADSTGGPEESLLDKDLGEMTFEAPEYAYAFSWDDYVGHGLEGVALAGRAPTRSGADFETALHSGKSTQAAAEDPTPDDWRALLTTQDQEKFKRRTSSNISVVENLLTDVHDWEIPVYPRHPFADAGSLATNGSVGDMSITSVSTSAQALVPNRRQRTVRRVAPPLSSPPSNYQPPGSPSVNLSFDAEAKNGSPRRETAPRGHAAFPLVDADKQARGVRLGLRGMKSRVNVLTSRIVALTIASSRSSSSPVFPSRRGTDSYDRLPSSTSYYAMGAAEPSWPSASVSPTTTSSSHSSARSPPSSASS